MKTNVHRFVTKDVNIRDEPTDAQKYSHWCDDLYSAKNQIGLITEESTIKSGVDWTKGAEGKF